MSILLSIETSTPVCSVALHNDDGLLAKASLHKGQSHSSTLNGLIDNLLNHTGNTIQNLMAVAVSEGPGSYTGLRIGASSAKGICYALDIPLIAVNTLQAMAKGLSDHVDGLLCPMLDARRMEVYAAVFQNDGRELKATQPIILDDKSFAEFLSNQRVTFFGDGSSKFKGVIQNKNAHFIDVFVPDAEFVGQLAFDKLQRQEFEDLAYFEPFYLKEFRATKPKSIL